MANAISSGKSHSSAGGQQQQQQQQQQGSLVPYHRLKTACCRRGGGNNILMLLLPFLIIISRSMGNRFNERLARSPDSAQIRHWKMAFSDDLAPVAGVSSRLWPRATVSCHWALNELCLRHVSCRELWTLFRRNCAVDAQNQCRMANKNDCWQSFEGISWTGLGSCTCAGNNSDCHWIRLQTNYNKCIYELNNDADWHTTLATAAQFSARSNTIMGKVRESVGVERWRDERQRHPWRAQDRTEAAREHGKSEEKQEGKARSNEAQQVKAAAEGMQRTVEKMEEKKQKMDDREREQKRKEDKEEKEEKQRKKSEDDERWKRIAKEEERKRRYEEERRKRWREEQRKREQKKEEKKGNLTKERVEEKKTEEREPVQTMTTTVSSSRRTAAAPDNPSMFSSMKRGPAEEAQNQHVQQTFKFERNPAKHIDVSKVMPGANTTTIISTTVVPPLRHRISPTAESQRLVTQVEQPPTWSNGRTRTTAPSTMALETTAPTTMAPKTTASTTMAPTLAKATTAPTTIVGPKSANSTSLQGTAAAAASISNRRSSTSNTTNRSISSSNSTCLVVLSQCDMDEPCRWHLTELRIKCAAAVPHGPCERRRRRTTHCAQALHRFVNFVPAPLAQAMVFCTCADDDANCRRAMFPFLDECSDEERGKWATNASPMGGGAVNGTQPHWTCTQTMKLCRLESDCRHRLSLLRSACPIAASPQNASAVRCAIPAIPTPTIANNNSPSSSLFACRAALTSARGSWLDEACSCPPDTERGEAGGGGTSCAELAETKWAVHPCVGTVRQHFNKQLRAGNFSLEVPTTHPARRGGGYWLGANKHGANGRRHNVSTSPVHGVVVGIGTPSPLGGKGNAMEMVDGAEGVTGPASTTAWGRQNKNAAATATTRHTNGAAVNQKKKPTMVTVAQRDDAVAETARKEGNGHKKELYEWKWTGDGHEQQQEVEEEARKLDNDDHNNKLEQWRENNQLQQQQQQQQLNDDDGHHKLLKTDNDREGHHGGEAEQRQQKKLLRIHLERHKTAVPLTEDSSKALVAPEATTTTFVTPKLPIEGDGCPTRNVDGEWITHHGDTVFRHYHDWAGRCSSWCECKSSTNNNNNASLQCHPLGCLADAQCAARHTTIGFGQRLYLEDRGACQCHDGGRFICDTSELMPDLSAGLYITMGYSKAELDMMRKNVPKPVLERSGLISQSASFTKDLAARLQFALERVLPEGTKCRVVLREHFAQEQVLLMQLQWFGVEPPPEKTASSAKQSDDNGNRKPKWHSGKWEKLCVPYVRELELIFRLERADRYQLLLSSIKQIRVIDLLKGLPPAALLSATATSAAAAATSADGSAVTRRHNLLLPQGIIIKIFWQNLCFLLLFKVYTIF